MSSTYHVHADLLDENFLASLKALYKGRNVEITVEAEPDETEWIVGNVDLMSRIEQATQDINDGKGILMTLEQLERHYSNAEHLKETGNG